MANIIAAFVVTAVIAYLLGSVNFSIIITEKFLGTDVRTKGSGNAGATNVLRSYGKLPAAVTFIGDFVKCIVAVYLAILMAQLFGLDPFYIQFIKYVGGICCIFGHIYPLYFHFKGGKGVTSLAAVVLMIDWRFFVIGISLFILIVLITRYVSLGSVLAAGSIPVCALVFGLVENNSHVILNTVLCAILVSVVIIKHHANIVRLVKGQESKIGSKKK